MIVVSDAGPLIHLAAIGRMDLVVKLTPTITIPEAEWREVVVTGSGLPGSSEVESADWIQVVTPNRLDLVSSLEAGGLDRGESEAIAVAVEREADLLLIDERQGRSTAAAMGLTVVGTIGIVVAARERGDIAAVAPMLAELRASGLWLSDVLVERVLRALGEAVGDAR